MPRAAGLGSAGARRGLQLELGIAWLADAALQFQPFMFGRGFVSQVFGSAARTTRPRWPVPPGAPGG